MAEIFIYDVRVSGAESVPADLKKQVTATDDLAQKLTELAGEISQNFYTAVPAWFNYLHILCHGFPQGLQLGSNFVNHNNVGVFGLLRGKVGHIVIHACQAAYNFQGNNMGQLMCRRMAVITQTDVTASDAVQNYLNGSSILSSTNQTVLQSWRGNVATWDRTGRRINFSTQQMRDAEQ